MAGRGKERYPITHRVDLVVEDGTITIVVPGTSESLTVEDASKAAHVLWNFVRERKGGREDL
jgi:hypothetical protein